MIFEVPFNPTILRTYTAIHLDLRTTFSAGGRQRLAVLSASALHLSTGGPPASDGGVRAGVCITASKAAELSVTQPRIKTFRPAGSWL